MNKVFILDDRVDRINNHMSQTAINELKGLCDSGNLMMKNDMPSNSEELSILFNEYSMLILHRSWMSDKGLINNIETYVNNNKKYLIIFSGGISQNLILNSRMHLSINSSNLYSDSFPQLFHHYLIVSQNMHRKLIL